MRALIASSALVAALLASAPAALAQQSAAFCMRGSESGGLNCSYDTMAQCQQSLPGASTTGTCIRNPRLGTTGSGSNSPSGDSPSGSSGQGSPPSGRGGERQ
jgi:hypothetical protein